MNDDALLTAAIKAEIHNAAEADLQADIADQNLAVLNTLDIPVRTRAAADLMLSRLGPGERELLQALQRGTASYGSVSLPQMSDCSPSTMETLMLGARKLMTPSAGGRPDWKVKERDGFPWEECRSCDGGCGFSFHALASSSAARSWKLASAGDVLAGLSELSAYVLERPEYRVPSPRAVAVRQADRTAAVVVRSGRNDPLIRLLPGIVAQTPRAEEALSELNAALQSASVWSTIVQPPHSILIVRSSLLIVPLEARDPLSGLYAALEDVGSRQPCAALASAT